jgi:putative chitinase
VLESIITQRLLDVAFPEHEDDTNDLVPSFIETCEKFEINTPVRLCMFLGQIAVESGDMNELEENLNYRAATLTKLWPKRFPASIAKSYEHKASAIANRAYASRMGNGPESSGDGFKYRGRCPIQCTGKDNYEQLTKDFGKDIGVDFVEDPDLLGDPKYGILATGSWWEKHKLNEVADTCNIGKVTQIINGGQIGIDERTKRTMELFKYFNIDPDSMGDE